MTDPLIKIITNFTSGMKEKKGPLLVALSGGVDSLALFELFYQFGNFPLAVAHVDHGWRESSQKEAENLKSYVESKGVPFHLKQTHPSAITGNLENGCRELRYGFFRELCELYGYQGVLVAHHAQDQIETLLKRLFEGASLQKISGIKPEISIFGVKVFRPLLSVQKSMLEAFVETLSFDPVLDETNFDCRFLRGKMRTKIVPFMEKEFGKGVSNNLLNFSEEMRELEGFLARESVPYLKQASYGLFIDCLDMRTLFPEDLFLFKVVVRSFLEKRGIVFSKEQVSILCRLLKEQGANKKAPFSGGVIQVDRGVLFVDRNLVAIDQELKIQEGIQQFGKWEVSFSKGSCEHATSWKSACEGVCTVTLPKGKYLLSFAKNSDLYPNHSSIAKWWNRQKVPQFLKQHIPVVKHNGEVVHEFLTGRNQRDLSGEKWKLELKYQPTTSTI